LVDITEVGTKPCIERMLASQIVEKLIALEKAGDPFGGAVSRYIQGLNMCKKLQSVERVVMKQHILRKVRSAVRGHKLYYRNRAKHSAKPEKHSAKCLSSVTLGGKELGEQYIDNDFFAEYILSGTR
jgi:hypothetical protein